MACPPVRTSAALIRRIALPGHSLPLLGLGVFRNSDDCYSACIAALKAGYRSASHSSGVLTSVRADLTASDFVIPRPCRHIDSAQVYRNEAEVGRAVRDATTELGIKREDIVVTSKCVSRNHGYEATLQGVDESLDKMGLCQSPALLLSAVVIFDVADLPFCVCSIYRPFPYPRSGQFVAFRSMCVALSDGSALYLQLSGSRKRLDTYRALVEKVKEGKLRSIGVSNL